MTDQSYSKTIAQAASTRLTCRAVIALCCAALMTTSFAAAAPVAPAQVLGDWEVTRLLVPDGFSNSQRFMKPDDARVMGRKYTLQMKSVTYNDELTECTLDSTLAKQTFPIKTLFADERTARPKIMGRPFYRRARHYALGSLAREHVTIYAYRCGTTADGSNPQINNTGNWFAATRDTIIWPLAPDALLLLKRQPTKATAEQAAFCASATLPSDKTLCADREMWLMKEFTDTYRDCAMPLAPGPSEPLRAQLDAYVAQRNACDGVRACVYSALDEQASLLAQSIHSKEQCTESKKK